MTKLIDEVNAWNRLLKKHIGQQKRQPNLTDRNKYRYNSKTKKIERLDKTGVVTATY